MSVCASCGRSLPCGCPSPRRSESALSARFGAVCPSCDAYNAAAQSDCVQCGGSLDAPEAASGQASAPAATPPTLEATRISKAPTPPTRPEARDLSTARTLLVPAEEMLGQESAPPAGTEAAPLLLTTPAQAAPAASPAPVLLTRPAASPTACPRCGGENAPDYHFCGACGAPLAAPKAAAGAPGPAAPLAPGRAALRVLRGDRLGQSLPVGLEMVVGRGNCELSFPRDPFLAPAHCTLSFKSGRLVVRDTGAASGTFVRIREEEPLAPGDYFSIGDHLLRFLGGQPLPLTTDDGTQLFGGPRPPPEAVQIEEIHEGLLPGRACVRLGPAIVFGREESCHVSFPGDRFVSSRHCQLTVGVGGRAKIKDLGSTNGTFRKIPAGEERELFRGDCLRVGGQVLQLVEV